MIFSPFTDNATLDERSVLNAFLSGYDRPAFEEWGVSVPARAVQDRGVRRRGPGVAIPPSAGSGSGAAWPLYDRIAGDPEEALGATGFDTSP